MTHDHDHAHPHHQAHSDATPAPASSAPAPTPTPTPRNGTRRFHDHPAMRELTAHMPFSISAVILALVVVAILIMADVVPNDGTTPAQAMMRGERSAGLDLFHLFHPIHLLFSAAATTAMFYGFERKVGKAVMIGLIGSIGVCSLSDFLLPFLSGQMLGAQREMHWCFWAHPELVSPFVIVGIVLGLLSQRVIRQSTFYSHGGHVIVSSLASVLYLTGYGMQLSLVSVGWVLPLMIVAVMLPCCFSDIVFPILFVKDRSLRRAMQEEHCADPAHRHD
jgi:hypothetical protein